MKTDAANVIGDCMRAVSPSGGWVVDGQTTSKIGAQTAKLTTVWTADNKMNTVQCDSRKLSRAQLSRAGS